MRHKSILLIVVYVLVAVTLLSAGPLAQAAPDSAVQAARRTPTPTPQPPTPTPTATPLPAATCWSVVPAPTLPGYGAFLRDIGGSSATDIWAVGEYLNAGIGHTLILHWNGSAWQQVASPDLVTNGTVDATTNELNAVTVLGPDDAWAVGYGVSTNVPYQTLTEHWNGTAWQIVPSPNVTTPGFYNALDDVTAIASNDIWAVGGVPRDVGAHGNYVLLMHWNGASWQLFPQPSVTATWSDTTRFGVTARASNDVWAVGAFDAWRWDGSAWQDVPGSGQNLLDTDTNGTALWSVGTVPPGYVEGYITPPSPVAVFLNGTAWTTTYPVDPPSGAGFNAVKVIASNDVWAVGQAGQLALTEQWNGSAWSVVQAAQANPNNYNALLGITAFGQGDMWAVGYYYDSGGNQRALIERYTCQ